ncbi:merozoite capping protein-1 [Pestalotiopsis sp. NC0098]|nr:merozoite capping protein-1 [Pestalotiopsis sp. NC0098]
MAPELRKRKAPPPAPEPAPKKTSKVSKAVSKAKEVVTGKPAEPEKAPAAAAAKTGAPAVGDVITLDGFGGEIETNDGKKTTLKALVDESKSGVVLFTYPKASTPGCTTQVCLFRDSYEPLTSGGLAIYGLSKDSPKANTTFQTKQKLPYPLLCDPSATLIGAIGLKKAPSGTTRGVFAVDKSGKVLLSEPGGPAATVNAVKALVEGGAGGEAKEEPVAEKVEEEKPAVAAADATADKPAESAPAEASAATTNGDTITEKAPEEAVKEPVDA